MGWGLTVRLHPGAARDALAAALEVWAVELLLDDELQDCQQAAEEERRQQQRSVCEPVSLLRAGQGPSQGVHTN